MDTVEDLFTLGRSINCRMPDLSTEPPRKIEELVRTSDISTDHAQPRTQDPVQVSRAHSPGIEGDDSHGVSSLIKDAEGRMHYIGPSGSLSFVAELQKLVAKHHRYENDQGQGLTFTTDNLAQALETNKDPMKDDQEDEDAVQNGLERAKSPSSAYTTALSPASPQTLDVDAGLRLLPDADVTEKLISSYFENVHDDHPLFHRATFQEQYETFVAGPMSARSASRSTESKADAGWLACVHLILVFGSIATPGTHARQSQRQSLSVAYKCISQLTTKCALSNVQALLLLSLYFHGINERNAAWNLVGAATRISFALGLHQNSLASQFRPVERETRRRVWCTLFRFEQFLCSSLGRPSGISDPEVEFTAPNEALLDGGISKDLPDADLRLQNILVLAKRVVGSRKRQANKRHPHGHIEHSSSQLEQNTPQEILGKLDKWKSTLSSHLQLPEIWVAADYGNDSGISLAQLHQSLGRSSPRLLRAMVLLHMQYHYITLLVTRPALLLNASSGISKETDRRGDSQSGPSLVENSFASAIQIALLVSLLDKCSLLNGVTGLDIYYAYSAAMVLLLRTLSLHRSTEEHEHDAALVGLVNELRATVAKTKKSKTMVRFAGVMTKFANVVDNIRAERRSDERSKQTFSRIVLTAPNAPMNDATMEEPGQAGTKLLQTGNPKYPGSHTSRFMSSTGHASAFNGDSQALAPNSSTDFTHRATNPYDQYNLPGQPFPIDSIFSGPTSGATMNFDENTMPFNDTLDAIANGFPIDWDELGDLMNGQLE